jgi:trimeric autotransporter adhesin
MKRIAISLFVSIFCIVNILAQTPQSFNYQTVLRGADGIVLSDKTVELKFSIVQNSSTDEILYSELHNVTTNSLGLISLKIGKGTDVTGNFSLINWSLGQYSLKTELDLLDGSGFQAMGTTELVSVPYALHAQTASEIDDADADPNNEIQTLLVDGDSLGILNGNKIKIPSGSSKWQSSGNDIYYNSGKVGIGTEVPASKLVVKGDESTVAEDLLFAVVNNANDTVFAVFQGGVRIYVDDNLSKAAGNKGGFAVGGFNSGKGLTNEFLRVTPDSVRIYVGENNGKATKGGFAVAGISSGKGIGDDYLRVSNDSVRIYVDQSAKATKGGFAVAGISSGKGNATNFLDLTPENYFIGHQAGSKTTTGIKNSFIGFESGFANLEGSGNIFLGDQSGFSNINGTGNIFIGNGSGYNNYGVPEGEVYNDQGSNNVFMGNGSGLNNISGKRNIYIGVLAGAGYKHSSNDNINIGYESGFQADSCELNICIGVWSGYNARKGRNIFIGAHAGYENTYGEENTILGTQAGENNKIGSRNTFLGNATGWATVDGSDNVYVGSNAGNNRLVDSMNTFIGSGAGQFSETGSNNVYLGFNTGKNAGGSNNVFIGPNVGYWEENDNKLYINNEEGQPLISGDFTNGSEMVVINAGIDINSNSRTFFVNGDAGGASAWNNDSDERLKKNIVTIPNALERVMKLRGVNFEWKETENHEEGVQMGFIAQEAVEVIPEVVDKKGEYYSMEYASINAILVEAIKEQQKQIEELQKQILELQEK